MSYGKYFWPANKTWTLNEDVFNGLKIIPMLILNIGRLSVTWTVASIRILPNIPDRLRRPNGGIAQFSRLRYDPHSGMTDRDILLRGRLDVFLKGLYTYIHIHMWYCKCIGVHIYIYTYTFAILTYMYTHVHIYICIYTKLWYMVYAWGLKVSCTCTALGPSAYDTQLHGFFGSSIRVSRAEPRNKAWIPVPFTTKIMIFVGYLQQILETNKIKWIGTPTPHRLCHLHPDPIKGREHLFHIFLAAPWHLINAFREFIDAGSVGASRIVIVSSCIPI